MIREANTSDAARIVRIHLNSWRSTYSNVFPKEVFDKQESEYNTRVENIKNAIEKGSSNYALLEEDNMVKAFICYGDARGDKYKDYKEIYSIYIEDNNQKKGYGTKLIKYCFDIFKKEGYITNSFHRSSGFIYNRENMHLSLGYNKYHSYLDMGIDDNYLDLDSYIIRDGYNQIVQLNDKFMSFIITYSPHSPYTYEKIECTTNLDDIKEIYPDITNEEYLCGFSAARETDNMFKLLLEKLKEDNLLEDTVIVAFSDHPNKIIISDDETEKLNKTKFFIYSSELDSNQIDVITSSINILPTIVNLFGIDNDYLYTGYDALNTNEEYVIFRDYTYYDGTDIKPLTSELLNKVEYSSNILISNYYKDSLKN